MRKKSFVVSILMGLVMIGADCNQPAATTTTNQPNQTPNETSASPDQTANAFTLSGEAMENAGEVKLQWNTPTNMDPTNRFRLIHGSTPGREVGQGAYWQDLVGSTREYIWSGVKSGNRYFRVCELKDGECLQTSNEIKLIVK